MSIVLVPAKGKKPFQKEWEKTRREDMTEEYLHRYWGNGAKYNTGVLLGEQSDNLTDLDLDCAEAV
jgi:hypothetical protein